MDEVLSYLSWEHVSVNDTVATTQPTVMLLYPSADRN